MSAYTDARSQPGQRVGGADDDRELFAKNYLDMLLEAWEQAYDFEGKTFVKSITSGKSDTFPIIGRKRDAAEHTPGEIILGGGIQHGDIEISLDGILFDSAFIADIDEYLAHYELARPYATQLGQSLADKSNRRIGAAIVNASRASAHNVSGAVAPSYYYHADIKTDPSRMEEAAFAAVEFLRTNDVGGGTPNFMVPWQQYLLLSRYTGIDAEVTTGSGNRSKGQVGLIAGLQPKGTNSIPTTNITSGTENRSKYQGDFTTTAGVIFTQMAVGTLRKKGVQVRMLDQGDRLGTLMVATKLEGHGTLRPECSFELATAART